MRISDWSSDVCSSDLPARSPPRAVRATAGDPDPCARARRGTGAAPRIARHADRAQRARPAGQRRGAGRAPDGDRRDRKGGGLGKHVAISVDTGGRLIKKKKTNENTQQEGQEE